MKKLFKLILVLTVSVILQGTSFAGSIHGYVYYDGNSNYPISDVLLTLYNPGNNPVGTYTTGSDGYYYFGDLDPGTYQLVGSKDDPGNGVTMEDAVLVVHYLAGITTLEPIQELAADVNGNGQITMQDFLLIVHHVNQGTQFPVGDWLFINETITVQNTRDSQPGGVTGTCAGDVGGVFVPGTREFKAYPIAENGILPITDNQPFTVDIKTSGPFELSGTALFIDFQPDLVSVEGVRIGANEVEYTIHDRQIQILWMDPLQNVTTFDPSDAVISLDCRPGPGFGPGSEPVFSINGTSAFVKPGQEIRNTSFTMPAIRYNQPEFGFTNFPNPFCSQTILRLNLPFDGNTNVSVFNCIGKQVYTSNLGFQKLGYHEFYIETSSWKPGKYIARITFDSDGSRLEKSIQLLKSR